MLHDTSTARRSFDWKENGRNFRLECKENNVGRFLLCSATHAEDKKHWLFFFERKELFEGLVSVGREN